MRPAQVLGALGLAAVLTAPAAAPARPFTIDDLLAVRGLGEAKFDPTGRWLAWEETRPHGAAATFHYEPRSDLADNQVFWVDLRRPRRPRRLLKTIRDGVTLGPFSPDGRHVVVYALGPADFRLGVVSLADGTVRWLGLTPELPVTGRTVQWRSSREVLVIARPAHDLPRELRLTGGAADRLPARWRAAAEGRTAVTVLGSGAELGLRQRTDKTLWRIDLLSGRRQALAHGDLHDLELSPDGNHLALTRGGPDIALDPTRPAQGDLGDATQRLRLEILDLATGTTAPLVGAWDLVQQLLSWSPSGRRLLVFARPDGAGWSRGQLLTVSPRAVATVERLGDNRPVMRYRPETVQAAWFGETPALLVRARDGATNWVALNSEGPRPLTARFGPPVGRLRTTGDGATIVAEGQAWQLRDGEAVQRPSPVLAALPPVAGRLEARLRLNPPAPDGALLARRADDPAKLVAIPTDGPPTELTLPEPSSRVLAYAPGAKAAVSAALNAHGETWLSLTFGANRTILLTRLNGFLAAVDPLRPEAIHTAGPDGKPLTSWLYRPTASANPPPLVVSPYPGAVYPRPLTFEDFNRPSFAPSVPALLGQGYAVLLPSLPSVPGQSALEGVADRLLKIVDAASAQAPGAFDPHRLAIWGHSYGGYATVGAIEQTDRFSAAIESAGPMDLISMWGGYGPAWRNAPEDGSGVAWSAGWVETAQPALGAPPWADPSRYVAASPLFFADRIQTPLMLVQGDQDEVPLGQAEEMYSALYRQNKDAVLLTYWGEGHIVRSAGNLRDLYRRVFDWLDGHFTPPSAPSAEASQQRPEPAPASGGPRSPPGPR